MTKAKLMCVESGTIADLCELYPKTGRRLKWLARKRREDLIKTIEYKKRIKTWVPFPLKEMSYIKDAKALDELLESDGKCDASDLSLIPCIHFLHSASNIVHSVDNK